MIMKVCGVDSHGILSVRPAPTKLPNQAGDETAFFQTQGSAIADFLIDHVGSTSLEQIIKDLTTVMGYHTRQDRKGLKAEVERLKAATKLHLINIGEGDDEDAGKDSPISND